MVPSTPARMLYRCFQCVAGLPGLGGRDGLVDLARAQEQLAAGAGCGAPGPGRAFPAGSGGEPDHDRLPSLLLDARAPHGAGGALRAGHLLVVPVDGERLGGVSPGAGLRRAAGQQRAEQGDAAGARRRSSRSAEVYPASTTCSAGHQPGGSRSCRGPARSSRRRARSRPWWPRCVIRFGACRVPSGSGSPQVSLRWTL